MLVRTCTWPVKYEQSSYYFAIRFDDMYVGLLIHESPKVSGSC